MTDPKRDDEMPPTPGEKQRSEPTDEQQQQQRRGQPAPGLKHKDAETSDSHGNTRDSDEQQE